MPIAYQLETPELQIEIGSDMPVHIEIEFNTKYQTLLRVNFYKGAMVGMMVY